VASQSKGRLESLLLSPWTAFAGMVLGALLGVFYKELAPSLEPFGRAYLALLGMCVYPVLLTAIATSIAGLASGGGGGRRMEAMLLCLAGFIAVSSAIGLGAGLLGRPGDIAQSQRAGMAGIVERTEGASTLYMDFQGEPSFNESRFSMSGFLSSAISPNIFESLAASRSLQILLFSIILGLALGSCPKSVSSSALGALESFYHAFIKIIRWAMYPLPVGLFCLVAVESSKVGLEMLRSMAGLIVVFHLAGFALLALSALVIWRRSGLPFKRSLSAMWDPIVVALGTRNSLATLPSAMAAMSGGLRFPEDGPRLLLPLSVTIGRFGNVLFFSLVAVFVAQLYGMPLGLQECAIILLCGSLAGMATSGASGALTLTMVMIVLEPLKLPWEAVVALLIAIDPVVDPMRTLLIVYPSCAFAALLSDKKGAETPRPQPQSLNGPA